MNTCQIMLRVFFGFFVILSPMIIGWALNEINFQPLGFILFAIYPQFFLLFYSGYIGIEGGLGVWLAFLHWITVLFSSAIFTRNKRNFEFIICFLILSILSVVFARSVMKNMGLSFFVDSI